ncbi:ring finger protein [Niveomyces insectorum RCEF 264]|uniref:RING-type E3 ubiquitin transferase n=1 Tax=Niveomyces insectorum RCEF 264 TaxID=1081102 RepID=A0A167PSK6_9HYPO|nr:ring finger protein [Niveomyces insectorum RCEF 264]
MRLAWYAGASVALAAGVVISAFYQRANFYSAMVYLYQSNLCMMVLVNLIALIYSLFVYGLQRICFGQLRAIEVEQLYEKAWFAVTETCLAMTIFRDDIGGFFIVMFASLLTGKVWGWIGEGRIEALEQQPPANPRLFHTRLSISLFLSLVYDIWLLRYAVRTVIEQARPDMMVMFLFEFAVLFVTSLHTALRYGIILLDTRIIKRQTRERLDERRRQVREEREAILRRRAAREAGEAGEVDDDEPLPDEDDVDEMDIEVPGWEAKGQYVLGLDLWTDFVKLCIYAVFFFVLLSFYGLPLHIIRDLFMTVRSFVKRLGALMKYRQAIRDMNKYADATEEDLTRENTCIICREDMHVWNPDDHTSIERSRPKKLPCGHILHLGCLKSWMERQQVCPTCRRSVAINNAAAPRNGDAVMFRIGLHIGGDGAAAGAGGAAAAGGANGLPNQGFPAANGAPAPPPQAAAGAAGQGPAANNNGQQLPAGNNGGNNNNNNNINNNGGGGLRMFNFGPFRLGFAQGGIQDMQDMAQRLGVPVVMAGGGGRNAAAPEGAAAPGILADGLAPQPPPPPPGATGTPATYAFQTGATSHLSTSPDSILADLQAIERRIEEGTVALQLASAEAQTLRLLLAELQHIRQGQANEAAAAATQAPPIFASPPLFQTPTPTQQAEEDHEASSSAHAQPSEPQQQQQQQQQQDQPPPQQSDTAQAAPPTHTTVTSQPRVVFSHTQLFGQPSAASFGAPRLAQPPAGFGMHGQRATAPTAGVHLTTDGRSQAIPAGSPELPAGVHIPAGWSLVPLQRFDRSALRTTFPGPSAGGLDGQGAGPGSSHNSTATAAEPAAASTTSDVDRGDASPNHAGTQSPDDAGKTSTAAGPSQKAAGQHDGGAAQPGTSGIAPDAALATASANDEASLSNGHGQSRPSDGQEPQASAPGVSQTPESDA